MLPHLAEHEVAGLTRSPEKLESLRSLGAQPIICDVYDYETLRRVTQRFRPGIVANFVTALSSGSGEEKTRVRREGGKNLLDAAKAAGAGRLVAESVAFPLNGDAGAAVTELEQATRKFPGDSVILRFGRLWGPSTYYEAPPRPPAIHIDCAGTRAAQLLLHASPGTYVLIEG
jgi:nucleoside-diphosphate-sugar epimerase